MANKPKFLKNLLTTASAITLVALNASSAMAANPVVVERTTSGAAKQTGENLNGSTSTNLLPFVNGSSLTFGTDNDSFTQTGNIAIQAINTNGKANLSYKGVNQGDISIGSISSLDANGSLTDVSGDATKRIALNFPDTLTIAVTGTGATNSAGVTIPSNNYSATGVITVGDSAFNIQLTQAGQIKFQDAVNSNVKGQATFGVNGNSYVYYAGGLGANPNNATGVVEILDKGKIQLGGTSQFSADINNASYILRGNGELLVDAGATLIGADKSDDTKNAFIGFAPNDESTSNGIITFLGIDDDKTTTINIEGGIGVLPSGSNVPLKTINIGNVKVDPSSTPTVNANEFIFNGNDQNGKLVAGANANKSELALGKTKTSIISKTGFSSKDGSGTVSINGADQTLMIGKFGDATNTLKSITFNSDNELVLQTAGSIDGEEAPAVKKANLGVSQVISNVKDGGILTLGLAENLTIINDIGQDGQKLKLVNIHSSDGAAAGPTTVTLNAGKAIYANQVDLSEGGTDNTIVLLEGSKIDGDLITTNDGEGNLSIRGKAVITGGIGLTSGNTHPNEVKFDVADKTLTVGGDTVFADGQGFNFDKDGTVVYSLKTPKDVAYIGKTTIKTDNTGAIDASAIGKNQYTVVQELGTKGKMLKSLKAPKGGTLLFQNSAQIKTVDVTGGGTIKLDGKKATYAFDQVVHGNGDTTIEISQAVNLGDSKASIISTKDNRLKAIKFTADDASLGISKATDIYTVEGITTTHSENSIGFSDDAGSSKIGGNIGTATNKLEGIYLGKNVQLELEDKVYLNEVVLDDNSKLIVDSAESMIDVISGPKATLSFKNNDKAIYTGKIGDQQTLGTIELDGTDVVIKNATVYADNIAFTNVNQGMTLDLTAAGTDVLKGKTITSAAGDKDTNRFHNIIVSGAQEINDPIGTADNKLGTITVNTDDVFKISTTDFYASVMPKTNGQATFEVYADNAQIYGIGANGASFKEANFNSDNIEVFGPTYAKISTIEDGKTVTFDAINGSNLKLGQDSHAKIRDGQAITVAVDGDGILEYLGNAKITTDMGVTNKLTKVIFSGDNSKTVDFAAKLLTDATEFGGLKFIINKNVNFGDVKTNGTELVFNDTATLNDADLNNTTFTLNNKRATISGTSTAAGTININTSVDKDGQIGNVFVGTGSTLDASAVTSANIDVGLIPISQINQIMGNNDGLYVILTDDNDAFTAPTNVDSINITGKNNLVNWIVGDADHKGLLITPVNGAEDFIKGEFTQAGASQNTINNALKLVNEDNSGSAARFRDEVLDVVDAKKAVEAVDRLVKASAQGTGEVMSQTAQAVNDALNNRMTGVNNAEINNMSESNSIAAGGDESLRHGIWFNPFYGQATQKTRKGLSGYKFINAGGTIGFDTLANDQVTIGAAATLAQADIKHRDKLAGDKTKVNSLLFSLYAIQNFAENWSAQLVTSFGSSKVKTKEKRVLDNTRYQTAIGKYDSMSYSGEATLAYNAKVSDFGVVIPEVTLGYNKSNDAGYTEAGTDFQNRRISKKAADKIYLKAGIRSQVFRTNYNGVDLVPELRASVTQDMKGKLPKVDITLDGMTSPITPDRVKPVRTFYKVGFGLNAKTGVVEYGFNGDATFANKYFGLTGSLTARVNI